MNTFSIFVRTLALWILAAMVSLLPSSPGSAATVVSGEVSGHWTTNGSPYILSTDSIVGPNQALTIQPGTRVTILPGVSLRVSGAIYAVGTPEQPITIAGASSTGYWDRIQLSNSVLTSRFQYCKISDGLNGLHLYLDSNRTMVTEILNNEFKNFRGYCIYGVVRTPVSGIASLAPQIRNNTFTAFRIACEFFIDGQTSVNPVITGNIFRDTLAPSSGDLVRAIGILGSTETFEKSSPVIANNVFARCGNGIDVVSPNVWPAIWNNLFIGNTHAMYGGFLPGTQLSEVKFNCLFQNETDFSGFPGAFGVPVILNNNGTPCDVYYNIFVDPKIESINSYRLTSNSPCIDAGDPAIRDVCFSLSRGTTISDIGAYGGPDACGWLTNGYAPIVTNTPFSVSSCVGGIAVFNVGATGTEPIRYQWYVNGNSLPGETNAQLTLLALQTNQAGNYWAVASNSLGHTTSATARLQISDACVGIDLYAGLSITGIVGRTYVVDATTNIAEPTWISVATNTLTSPRWLLVDTNTPFNARRYFRTRLVP